MACGQPRWWQSPEILARYVRDVLCGEMVQLRPGGWPWPRRSLREPSPIGSAATVARATPMAIAPLPQDTVAEAGHHDDVDLVDDLGADSLELMSLSAALAETLDLRRADEIEALQQAATWRHWTAVARQRLARDDAVVRFATSGTTGAARRCAHDRRLLEQELQAWLMVLEAGGPLPRRLLLTVRSHHIYGFLYGALLPAVMAERLGSAPPVIDLVGCPPALALARAQDGDLVIGYPDWWAAAVRGTGHWPEGVIGMTATAPCPPTVVQAVTQQGVARWMEVYGSTETGGVGWRDRPDQPFRLHRYWQRSPQGLQRIGPAGEVSAPVEPADALQWEDDHRFWPQGRHDGLVQVGGVNVNPTEIRRRLLAHPGVADAAVRLHDGAGGARLKAWLVPSPGVEPASLVAEVRHWCALHLRPAERPVHLSAGVSLPRNEMGKLRDWDPHDSEGSHAP